jgi:carbon monoxide dehydrogenase subunit G
MKVAGEAVLHAPIDKVWAALNDPAVLVRTIPGCERLEATGPDAYAMTVSAGVASIKGTYAGNVALSDQQQPNSFIMKASGAGGPGTVSADVKVALAEVNRNTRLTYDADAIVGGVIGGVGQRMLAGVAKKMAGEFFGNVDDVLTGNEKPAIVPASTADAPGVFVAPQRQSALGSLGGDNNFVLGAIVGAAIALLGVLVGARTGRRSR